MNEEDQAFEELAKRQGDWGLQGSRKHQIMRYLENDAMREVQRLGQEIEQTPVQFKCTVIDDAHPNGIPLEQWTPPPQRKPLTNGEIYTAYITATNQTLRATDERLAFAFARAIEAAHGIKENQ